MGKAKPKLCCHCGKPAARQTTGSGRRVYIYRAWCPACLRSVQLYGTVDRPDDYPSWAEAKACGAYVGRLAPHGVD